MKVSMKQFCNNLDVGERELVALLSLFVFLVSRDCFLALPRVPWVCLQFVILVFPDHTQ